jgi:hypothetical protein
MPVTSPAPLVDHAPHPFLAFCRCLTLDERIALVKCIHPLWTARQIADVCEVSERTIRRSRMYRRLREIDQSRPPAQSQWRDRTHRPICRASDERGFSNPDDPCG